MEDVMTRKTACFVFGLLLCLSPSLVSWPAGPADANVTVKPGLFDGLRYRLLDFSRGGRSTAVAGVASDPLTYYFGSTGGGVWKTRDAGLTWTNISDGFFEAGSIGAIAVAESDPNVIYVGTGSACPRGNISPGVGMYKSTDAGKTWKHAGLREAGQIGRVQVHPKDCDLVYVAAVGHIFGPNDERGVFRSKDGGKTWDKVLFISRKTGAVDLSLDPNNPRVLYAAAWTVERKPWTIDSGSEESGLFKTTDGGETWTRVSGGGFPSGIVGKIGIAAAPARPDRVWALVEAPEDRGGLFRSDNGGQNWQKVNGERRFLQRAWYYIHVYADPKNADSVYVLNTGFYKSLDGGRTFQSSRVPHGDNHDLWVNPSDPMKMINANDGGANVSFNGGLSWSGQMNQPTAEIYRITADTRFPYRVYGAQQDNSTASVRSRGAGDFYDVGGGESGHIAVDPRNPDIVYAGSYGGDITRFDAQTGLLRSVVVYPESATGQRAADMKLRFQWNAPIRISPHDPDVVYACSQFVHRSRDGGLSWETISPDLTRNDKAKQDYSGKPITHDNTGVEVFCTVFAFEESPLVKGLLWAGSDDGLVHVSKDAGASWKNVTPAGLPAWGTVNMIEPSAHDPGRAFIAVHKYREDDFRPYIFRTTNTGESWTPLTDGKNGIPAGHFVRVVREDPDRKGLLYAGTEFGMYVSFDDGAHWQTFQLNLPVTPVMDLMVYRKDLLVATQGRSFWILDDLSPLHQLNDTVAKSVAYLFAPRPAYRAPEFAAEVNFYLAEAPKDPVTLEILDGESRVVRTFASRPGGGSGPAEAPGEFARYTGPRFSVKAGFNRFVWDLSREPAFQIPPKIVMWGGGGAGPKVVPGTYRVRLNTGDYSQAQTLEVLKDPRNPASDADYAEQLELARQAGERVRQLYAGLLKLRDIRKQALDLGQRLEQGGYGQGVLAAAKILSDKFSTVEAEITQVRGEGGQDALNFPGRHDNQWVRLYNEIIDPDGRPTAGCRQRFEDLKPEFEQLLTRLEKLFDADLAEFNKMVKDKGFPAVVPASEAVKK
jgi:photosystem II stability/assembly factor-like uncharacterized protein